MVFSQLGIRRWIHWMVIRGGSGLALTVKTSGLRTSRNSSPDSPDSPGQVSRNFHSYYFQILDLSVACFLLFKCFWRLPNTHWSGRTDVQAIVAALYEYTNCPRHRTSMCFLHECFLNSKLCRHGLAEPCVQMLGWPPIPPFPRLCYPHHTLPWPLRASILGGHGNFALSMRIKAASLKLQAS